MYDSYKTPWQDPVVYFAGNTAPGGVPSHPDRGVAPDGVQCCATQGGRTAVCEGGVHGQVHGVRGTTRTQRGVGGGRRAWWCTTTQGGRTAVCEGGVHGQVHGVRGTTRTQRGVGGGGVAPDGVQRRKEAGLPCVKEASMAKYMASEVRVAHSGGGGGGGGV